MALTKEEVAHIAQLARLSLTEEELETYRDQLSAILDHFAQLSALDTEGISPTSSVLPAESRLREDAPRSGLGAEKMEKNAPDWTDDQFRVPPIFE